LPMTRAVRRSIAAGDADGYMRIRTRINRIRKILKGVACIMIHPFLFR